MVTKNNIIPTPMKRTVPKKKTIRSELPLLGIGGCVIVPAEGDASCVVGVGSSVGVADAVGDGSRASVGDGAIVGVLSNAGEGETDGSTN